MPPTSKPRTTPTCDAYLGDHTRCREAAAWCDNRRGLYMCDLHFRRLLAGAPSNRTGFRPLAHLPPST